MYASNVIAFKNQSRKTMEMNSLALKSLQKHIGDIDVSLLTFEHIRKWKEKLEDERKSTNTVRGYIIKLRCVLAYLRKLKIDTLDVDEVPIPKRCDTAPAWITPEDVEKLILACKNHRARAIVSLLYASGIRVSELCSLNRDQLHEGKFTITGKGGKTRICFYDARTAILVKIYLRGRKDNHPALFVQRNGSQRLNKSSVELTFRTIRVLAGFDKPITPHTLRHSYASDLMQKGMPIYSLSRLMGHSSIQTTSQYLHVSDPKLQEDYTKYHTI